MEGSRRLPLFLLLCYMIVVTTAKRNAFISILSSDDFLLPAKVVAHQLKTINSSVPYLILATEDVSNHTIEVLLSRDVTVLQIHKIDTPFLDTHVGAKYQYTKIRLWSLTDYDMLFHIDLDTLPLSDLSAAFHCGRFCATFRHSDKFNAGIFVLQPNITVYLDLLEKSSRMDSYDGGDQGFFNNYFEQLKYAPMFNDNDPLNQKYAADIRRLSSSYNYDIGMYYLNGGHILVQPKLIHYTLGPTKPWAWWTFPVFDLNQIWLQARMDMENAYREEDPDKMLLLLGVVVAAAMFGLREVTLFVTKNQARGEMITSGESKYLPLLFTVGSTLMAFLLTPAQCHPVPSWIFFASCSVSFSILLSDLYVTLRIGRSSGLIKMFSCLSISLSLIGSSWTFLALIPSFGLRATVTIPIAVANLLLVSYFIRLVILNHPIAYYCAKYQVLPVRKDCAQ